MSAAADFAFLRPYIRPIPREKSWTASAYLPERHLSARLFPKHLSIILRPPSDLCACGHELYFQDRLFPAFHSIEFVVFGVLNSSFSASSAVFGLQRLYPPANRPLRRAGPAPNARYATPILGHHVCFCFSYPPRDFRSDEIKYLSHWRERAEKR